MLHPVPNSCCAAAIGFVLQIRWGLLSLRSHLKNKHGTYIWLRIHATLSWGYMMASSKQLEANRANAKKSTGPRSQGGKARSRLNSRKHGLTAKTLVIGDEDPAQFDKLRAELMAEYDPQSALECELVERLSSLLWRLRRIPAFEAAIIDARRAEVDDPLEWLELERQGLTEGILKLRILGAALIQDGKYHDALGKLARHETTLMHAFTKTLQMLFILKSNRSSHRGDAFMIEPVTLPPKA